MKDFAGPLSLLRHDVGQSSRMAVQENLFHL